MNKLHKVDDNKEILINIMYNGEYLDKNLGHEVINLIPADGENNYIYINPYGKMALSHYSCNKDEAKIDTILLARRCEYKDTLEILAQAYGLKECFPEKIFEARNKYEKENPLQYVNPLKNKYKKGMKSHIADRIRKKLSEVDMDEKHKEYIQKRLEYQCEPKKNTWKETQEYNDAINEFKVSLQKLREENMGKEVHAAQMNYVKENKITYQGKCLEGIFAENSGNEFSIYTTFKANHVVRVKNPIYITTNNEISNSNPNIINLNKNSKDLVNFAKQSLKMYFSKNSITTAGNDDDAEEATDIKLDDSAFCILKDIIENPTYWNFENNEQKFLKPNKSNYNFIEIIRREYDELIFSNLFGYIFGGSIEYFCKFVNEVLFKKEKETCKYNINENIQYSHNLNKTFSIIREKEKNIDLLITIGKHVIVIENKIKSDINGIKKDKNGNIIETQLGKYAGHILKNEKYSKMIPHFFVFAPDYKNIRIEYLKLENNITYTLINYSDIYNFFCPKEKDKAELLIKEYKEKGIIYIEDFINAIERHIYKVDNIKERQMFERFAERIAELNEPNQK